MRPTLTMLVATLAHGQLIAPFTRVTTGDLVTLPAWYWGGEWGDYDDDGHIDLAVTSGNPEVTHNARPAFGTKCSNGIIDPGEECEDGNYVGGDCCSARCIFGPAGSACPDDGNVCTDEASDATGSCTHLANSAPCSAHNPCTSGDFCSGSTCIAGAPVTAGSPCSDDYNVCTDDVCDGNGTCMHVPNSNTCNDGNPCTDDVCNGTGTCTPLANVDPCDDGNACSAGDVCAAGACTPTGVAPECIGPTDLTGSWSLGGPYADPHINAPSLEGFA